jgi:hypothetical protein
LIDLESGLASRSLIGPRENGASSGGRRFFIPNPIFRERPFRATSRASHETPSNERLLRARSGHCRGLTYFFVVVTHGLLQVAIWNGERILSRCCRKGAARNVLGQLHCRNLLKWSSYEHDRQVRGRVRYSRPSWASGLRCPPVCRPEACWQRRIHADAPGPDDALVTHLRQRREGAFAGDVVLSSQPFGKNAKSGEISCTNATSRLSTPSRCRLSSIERRTPSAVLSNTISFGESDSG